MRKTLIKCVCITLLALCIAGVAGLLSLSAGESKQHIEQQTATSAAPKYTFSAYQGKLALFENGYAMPVEIYDVYLDTLPPEEQTKIENGIFAESDVEIQKIIEDYTS